MDDDDDDDDDENEIGKPSIFVGPHLNLDVYLAGAHTRWIRRNAQRFLGSLFEKE